MKTSKPVSTISYNSEGWLKKTILKLKEIGDIEFAMWIYHEPDEDNRKPHYHVYLQPAKMIQTTDWDEPFTEPNPSNIELPFKALPFRSSKETDWLLYGIHDPTYLQEKNMTRNVFYSFDDVQSTCQDALNEIISRLSDDRKGKLEYRIIDCVNRGLSWHEIVASGLVPIRYIYGAKLMYEALVQHRDVEYLKEGFERTNVKFENLGEE